jgi:GNAT superfamily N-acetyltransferase
VVRDGVEANHAEVTGREPARPLAVLARRDGAVVAGATGFTQLGWLFVSYLWASGELRGAGLGRDILGRAEAEARERGCHAVWLDKPLA